MSPPDRCVRPPDSVQRAEAAPGIESGAVEPKATVPMTTAGPAAWLVLAALLRPGWTGCETIRYSIG